MTNYDKELFFMKALKEKRIGLRSLWRRSLVILSLLALVFAACGDSGSSDSSTPDYTPTKAISGVEIIQYPSSFGGDIYEGTNIDLTGIRVVVKYVDGTIQYVTDPKKLYIYPPIFDDDYLTVGSNNYIISYFENKPYVMEVPAAQINTIIRLDDIHYTGDLNMQEYCVDDIPDFKGIMVEGVYRNGSAAPGVGPGSPQEQTIHKTLFLSPDYTEWAWVYNDGTSYVGDNTGILVKVGTFGSLATGATAGTHLVGLRIPVKKLFQVEKVEFSVEPSFKTPVYADDPTLIAAVAEGTFSYNKWQRTILGDGEIMVSYRGTDRTKKWSMSDIDTFDLGDTLITPADSRLWVKPVLSWVIPGGAEFTYNGTTPPTGTAANWRAWAVHKAPKIRVTYRGQFADVTVPVYNKLSSIVAVSRDEETVVMAGTGDAISGDVYNRADGYAEFHGKVKISATYTQNLDSTVTSTRDDLWADLNNGTCRNAPTAALGTLATSFTHANLVTYTNTYKGGAGKTTNISITFTPQMPVTTTALAGKSTRVPIGAIGYLP
jgi:hypothetical protein